MSDWIKDVRAGLEQREQEKERGEKLELHRREVSQSKASFFFGDLMRSADEGVTAMKSRREFAKVVFQELNKTTFKVKNPVYPSVTVHVQLFPDAIRYERATAKDARSDVVKEQEQIEFGIDSADNLILTHNGRPVLGKDEVLHLMLDSVFRL
jgi:hypothetical protein